MGGSLFPIILTPQDEVDAYASLTVPLDSGICEVSITKYRCDNKAFGKDATHGGTQEAIKFKDVLLGKAGKAILNDIGVQEYVGVFLGKGSRRDIISVLQWVDRMKLLDPKLPKEAALQKICDDYIGLDCNGFVGNWAEENCVTNIGPSTPPASMGQTFVKNKRAKLEDIQPYDILVWHEHVAAVESIGPVVGEPAMTHRVAQVGEAYGAIMCQERTIRPAAQAGKFQVGGHTWAACEVFGIGLGPAFPPILAATVEAVAGMFQ